MDVPNGTRISLFFKAADPLPVWGSQMLVPVVGDYVSFESWAATPELALADLKAKFLRWQKES